MRASDFINCRALSLGLLFFAAEGHSAPALRSTPPVAGPTIIHVKSNGEIVPKDGTPIAKSDDLKRFLEAEMERQKAAAARQDVKTEPAIIVRADRRAQFAKIHSIVNTAQEAGFKDVTIENTNDR